VSIAVSLVFLSALHRLQASAASRFAYEHMLTLLCCAVVISLQVTNMARQMVINYGMSDIGPWSLLDPSAQSGDVVMRMMARNSMSENLQQRIDDAVKKIAEEAYEVALRHIRDNRWVHQHSCSYLTRCCFMLSQQPAVCTLLESRIAMVLYSISY
jgi:hypothetical protein